MPYISNPSAPNSFSDTIKKSCVVSIIILNKFVFDGKDTTF
jgi:hypothetical protein